MTAHELAVFVRSDAELPRARDAATAAGLPIHDPTAGGDVDHGAVRLCTMHDAKGTEFRAVTVIACDEDVVPSATRLLAASDVGALDTIMETERHLLYVAATRARERLWISGAGTVSEFLEDLI